MIDLSIIIVNFNTASYLNKCLNSLYKNIGIRDFEVYVVDNASTRDSLSLIQKNFPGVKYIFNKKNLGFARANNLAVRRTKGEFILFLNPDTIIDNKTIPVMFDLMKNNPDAEVATCKVVLANGILDDSCHRGFPTPWRAFCYFSGLAKFFPNSIFLNGYHLGYRQMDKTHEIDSGSGAFMMVRKKTGEKIGWFDENYFWYGEDLDFCYRIKRNGGKVFYVPEVKIIHFKGVASGIKPHSQHLSAADNKIKVRATRARFEVMRIFYKKHYKESYPFWIYRLVDTGISLLENIALRKYK